MFVNMRLAISGGIHLWMRAGQLLMVDGKALDADGLVVQVWWARFHVPSNLHASTVDRRDSVQGSRQRLIGDSESVRLQAAYG